MADGFVFGGASGGWDALLARYIGETVTIFTKSGGESGSGFTGVLMSVNPGFVRLLTRIGPPPGCSLGNACSGYTCAPYGTGGFSGVPAPVLPASVNGAVTAGGWDCLPVYTVGSVADIPVSAIVSFVHNAV